MADEGYTFHLGDIVLIKDQISPEYGDYGIIKMIEPDEEMDFLTWLYITADTEILNDKYDPRIGNYFTLIESHSPYIELVHVATDQ